MSKDAPQVITDAPETPKKLRLTKRTKIFAAAAIATIVAGAAVIIKSNQDENELQGVYEVDDVTTETLADLTTPTE